MTTSILSSENSIKSKVSKRAADPKVATEEAVSKNLDPVKKVELFRCGRIAIVGRPNSGKSTLLNAIMDLPFAAVSKRPQTTRTAIRGILSSYASNGDWESQLVFVDTPGLNFSRGLLERAMFSMIEDSLSEVDIVLWLSDRANLERDLDQIAQGFSGEDKIAGWIQKRLQQESHSAKWIVGISKVDKEDKLELLPLIQRVREVLPQVQDVVPVAAVHGRNQADSNLSSLIRVIREACPVKEPEYESDAWTDLSEKQLLQNLVREQLFEQFHDEVPYETDCTVERWIEPQSANRKPEVDVVVWTSRPSLKPILVGKAGVKVRDLGMKSRERYQQITGTEIILRLQIKVVERWASRAQNLAELGYVLQH